MLSDQPARHFTFLRLLPVKIQRVALAAEILVISMFELFKKGRHRKFRRLFSKAMLLLAEQKYLERSGCRFTASAAGVGDND